MALFAMRSWLRPLLVLTQRIRHMKKALVPIFILLLSACGEKETSNNEMDPIYNRYQMDLAMGLSLCLSTRLSNEEKKSLINTRMYMLSFENSQDFLSKMDEISLREDDDLKRIISMSENYCPNQLGHIQSRLFKNTRENHNMEQLLLDIIQNTFTAEILTVKEKRKLQEILYTPM